MGCEPAEFNGPTLRRTRMSFELEEVMAKLPIDSLMLRLHSARGGKRPTRYIGIRMFGQRQPARFNQPYIFFDAWPAVSRCHVDSIETTQAE